MKWFKLKSQIKPRLFWSLLAILFFMGSNLVFAAQTTNAEERNDMLAAASVLNGHAISQACTVCHTFDKGGPIQTGPNLFGIVGAKHGHDSRYTYSDVLKKMGGTIWTTDRLDKWLKSPSTYAPGTKMAFGGLLDPQDRADVIAYLQTLK